jgi:hypothetical protein
MTMADGLPDHPGRGIPGIVEEDAKKEVAAGGIEVGCKELRLAVYKNPVQVFVAQTGVAQSGSRKMLRIVAVDPRARASLKVEDHSSAVHFGHSGRAIEKYSHSTPPFTPDIDRRWLPALMPLLL